jgi:hypothetical protein
MMRVKAAPFQAAPFYEFDLDRHVPPGHLLRAIDRFVDLSGLPGPPSSLHVTRGAGAKRRPQNKNLEPKQGFAYN